MSTEPSGTAESSSSPVSGVQPLGEVRAAAVDADERDGAVGVLLDDLVGDPHERAAHVIAVEDDRRGFQLCSFLASRDRVKGAGGVLARSVAAPPGGSGVAGRAGSGPRR